MPDGSAEEAQLDSLRRQKYSICFPATDRPLLR
jgi:hypothetical protein